MEEQTNSAPKMSKVVVEVNISDLMIDVDCAENVTWNYWCLFSLLGSKSTAVLKPIVSMSSFFCVIYCLFFFSLSIFPVAVDAAMQQHF